MSAGLEAEHLSKRFGGFHALDDVSFRFDGGGAVGYLGPNGAGKTTTLKLFTHLLRPSSGSARIGGIDVADDPKSALADVGAMVETPEPYGALTGRETLRMIGRFRGLSAETIRDRTERFATELELPPLDRPTARLSKGQKQRIVLAGVLLADPAVLLLDEPTSGLDPAERVIVRNILLRLRGRDRLILMSSHLLQEVTEICDRVIFVSQGRILLEDRVEAVNERFRVTRVDVEFAAPVAPTRLRSVPGVLGAEALGPTRVRLSFDGTTPARLALLRGCQEVAPVLSFASSSLTLEDAYVRLIQPPAA